MVRKGARVRTQRADWDVSCNGAGASRSHQFRRRQHSLCVLSITAQARGSAQKSRLPDGTAEEAGDLPRESRHRQDSGSSGDVTAAEGRRRSSEAGAKFLFAICRPLDRYRKHTVAALAVFRAHNFEPVVAGHSEQGSPNGLYREPVAEGWGPWSVHRNEVRLAVRGG